MSEEAPTAAPVDGADEGLQEPENTPESAPQQGEGTGDSPTATGELKTNEQTTAAASAGEGEEKKEAAPDGEQVESLGDAAAEPAEIPQKGTPAPARKGESSTLAEAAPEGSAPMESAQAKGESATAAESTEHPVSAQDSDNKPSSPRTASKPSTPTIDAPTAEAGSKPATPATASGQAPADAPEDAPKDAPAAEKPATPAEKPATPTEKTASPAEKPATPTEKPVTPAEKPVTPAEKPVTPAEKPATPAKKPVTPAEKPATPVKTSNSVPPTPPEAKPATPAKPMQPQAPPPPPPIGPAAVAVQNEEKDEKSTSSALNMTWSFGVNKNVPVLNLTDDLRQSIMYPCANAGVIYDFANNSQIILQGHSNDISCTCTSYDKRWIATADIGPDNMIIVWDSYTGVPVRTIFEPYPSSGILAIAMTPDAKYIATISAAEKQVLAIWDWTIEGELPVCSILLDPKYGVQNYVLFNPEDINQLVTNSDSQVIFYNWSDSSKIELQAPPLSDEDFNKPVGKYSQSIFQSGCTRALTATSIGNLVVWDTVRPAYGKEPSKAIPEKKALKLVRLQERGINVLTTTEECDIKGVPPQTYIVAGDVLGHVKFLDQTLKLVNWYQDLHLGPINSLSFAHWPDFVPDVHSGEYPKDATNKASHFAIRDFVIGAVPAVYAHMKVDGTDIQIIHRDHDSAVHGLSASPCRHHIVVGGYSGLLKIWDYKRKEALVSRWFDKGLMIRCCTYNHSGNYIAVGFTNGSLRIVDALTLNDILSQPFRYARDAITHVAFSHDGKYLATADAEHTVSVFKAQKTGEPWVYLGRNRAHYKLIHDLCFGVHLDSDAPRLLSLGEDRVLVEYAFDNNMSMKVEDLEVEYDLEKSGLDDLRVASSDRIEQSAVPQCMAWYPPVTAEFFIVTANDQFKFKLYNATTKMCRKTLLGPTYGTPVQKIVILPTDDPANDKRYLAYVTSDKIGIHKLPLDGNPHNAMALIAHPQGVANVVSSYDGKYLFTAGGNDCSVHMWAINVNALEAQAKLGGDELIPFYGLMEGGRDGDLYKELEDYFYYAQIRSQGVDTQDERRVSTHIPLSEIPFVMRALGFYPSEQEIEDMLNEVRYSRYVETGQYMTETELGDFIKLYINHRPAFGLQADKIDWAFRVLGMESPEGGMIDRGDLLDMLQSCGEHLTEEQLAEYLTTLLGFNAEGGSSEHGRFDPSLAGDIIEDNLPQDITADMFANELLGFGMYNELLMEDQGEVKMVEGQAG